MPNGQIVRKVFISYASEDRDFVGKLAEILEKVGVDVWYDQYSLKAGDSLMSTIDAGLAHCDFGIVILSKAFLTKKWTKRELRGLVQLETNRKDGLILPVWLDVDKDEILEFSPPLADAVAVTVSGRDSWEVARDLLAAIDPTARFSLRAARSLEPRPGDRNQQMTVELTYINHLPPRPLRMSGPLAIRATLCELAFPMSAEPDLEEYFTALSQDVAPERELLIHEVLAAAYFSVFQEHELNKSERGVLRRYLIGRSLGMDTSGIAWDALAKDVREAADSHYARLSELSSAVEFIFRPADLPEQVTVEAGQSLASRFVNSEQEVIADMQRVESLMTEKRYGEAARIIEGTLGDHPSAGPKATFMLRSRHAYAIGMSGKYLDAIAELLVLIPEATEHFGAISEESFSARANHADFTGMAGDTLRAAQLYERLVLDIEMLNSSHWSARLENMINGAHRYLIDFMENIRKAEPAPSKVEVDEVARLFRELNGRINGK